MNPLSGILPTIIKSADVLTLNCIVRYASAIANQKSKVNESYTRWNENRYLAKYFQQRFGNMNILPKSHRTYPIYASVERLENLSSRRDQMDQIEYTDSVNTELKEFSAQLKLMNQKEIAFLLNDLKDSKAFTDRWSTKLIDLELRWILKSYLGTGLMDLDLSLYLAHIFYTGNIRSTYVGILVKHLSQNVQPMTDEQLVYSLFLAMLTRHSTPMLNNYHEQIKGIVARGSIEEIATICMTYFKTKTKILDRELFDLIVNRTIGLMPGMNLAEPGYCAIIKCLRYSQAYDCRPNIQRLVKVIKEQSVMLTSPYNIVHTLKLMETYRIYDERLFEVVYGTFVKSMNEFRIKDIQYIMTSLSNLALNNSQLSDEDKGRFDYLCKQIVNDEREDAHMQHIHVIPLMRALALFNYYNQDLAFYVDKCLSKPSLLAEMSETLEFDRSMLLLHAATKLESNLKQFPANMNLLHKLSASIKRSGNVGSISNDNTLEHLNFIINDKKKYLTISNTMRDIGMELSTRPDLMADSFKIGFQITFAHQNYGDLVLSRGVRLPGNFDPRTLMPVDFPEGQTHIALLPVTKYDFVDGAARLSGFKTFLARLMAKCGYHTIHVNTDDCKLSQLVEKIKSINGQQQQQRTRNDNECIRDAK